MLNHKLSLLPLLLLLTTSCGEKFSWPDLPVDPYWPQAPSEYAIGILTGPDPFNLTGSIDRISNPVLSASDIPDMATAYLADPFLFYRDGRWYMFYELLRASPRRGCIGWAESDDGRSWQHRGIAIDEPFHLSYPLVFEHDENMYLLLESHEAGQVRLYETTGFPEKWTLASVLLEGVYVDPTIFRHQERWWIFASDLANLNLFLFYSDDLMSGWKEHPLSPVIRNDIMRARQGGRTLEHEGRLWRFAQNCYPRYGTDTRHYEIVKLTTTEYEERDGGTVPLISAGLFPWATLGMHHVDHWPYETGDEAWIVAVDGNTRVQPETRLEVAFADGSLLLGATKRPALVSPGEVLLLRLYWKNLPRQNRPVAFVHFKRNGETLFQADHHLDDKHAQYDLFITVPEDISPGELEIHIGLHQDGRRIPARSPYPQHRHAVVLPITVQVAKTVDNF